MSFYLNYESPVLKKSFKIKELTFGQFRDLNKYILSNNNIFIESFFDEILTNNLEQKDLLKQLCNYDKFCILVLLRTVNISPELEIFEKNKNFKVPLKDFLNKCLNFTHDTTKNIEHDNIKIKLELPASFVINNLLDLTDMVVKRVEIDNSILNFNEIESELKKEIIETLPANIIFDIKKFYENLVNVFSELSFTLPSINETINLNPFDSSLLEILKLLFRANLKNIYEMQYFMVSKMYYTPEYIDNNTFVENVLLLRLFEDELKKQDELSKKPKQQGMPLMP
jgi:hypothetical protein